MCGIVAIIGHPQAAGLVRLALHNLQHRGEEAAGIASSDGSQIHLLRKRGWVGDVITDDDCEKLVGNAAVGHVRYSTEGGPAGTNTQPLFAQLHDGPVALVHNGHIPNFKNSRSFLEKSGAIFQTSSDTELLFHLMARSSGDLSTRFSSVLKSLIGAFSLAMLTTNSILIGRDHNGIRPLVKGKMDNGAIIYASESCAIEVLGGKVVDNFPAGYTEEITFSGQTNLTNLGKTNDTKMCIFEYVYFARPDSTLENISVYQSRVNLGIQLAKECPVDADIVVPVPDSGIEAAIGYARESSIPFEKGIIRAHYAGRTFIQPNQDLRNRKIRMKLNPVPSILKGKRVVVIDDSIVRGNTCRRIVSMLKEVGTKEIHMRISSPPIVSPCYYGIDTPETEDLIAANLSIENISKSLGCDSLKYLSHSGMVRAVGLKSFCDACFTKNYPV